MKKASLIFALVLFFVATPDAEAVSLYLDPLQGVFNRGDTVTVAVRLGVGQEDECVNSAEIVLEHSPGIRAVDISRGNSIFSLWVEEPLLDEENNTIRLVGGIPGGYCGRIEGDPNLTNTIADIVFQVPGFAIGVGGSDNIANVSFVEDQTKVLLNDGLGTEASLTFANAEFGLGQVGKEQQDNWLDALKADGVAPEEFSIELVQDDKVFSGEYYIVFNTNDKQTGVDHYEVREDPIKDRSSFFFRGDSESGWVRAESPYVLKDQTLNSIIRVRVFDKAGNERIAGLIPDESLRQFQFGIGTVIAGAVSLLIVIVLILGGLFFYKRFRERYTQSDA